MNAAEKLARELVRVAELRSHYEEISRMPNIDCRFAIASMSAIIERGCIAAGTNDAIQVLQSLEELKGCEK